MQLISERIKRAERVSLQTTNLTFENQTCFTCSVAYLLLKNREADHNFIVFFQVIAASNASHRLFESTFWNAKVIQTFFLLIFVKGVHRTGVNMQQIYTFATI